MQGRRRRERQSNPVPFALYRRTPSPGDLRTGLSGREVAWSAVALCRFSRVFDPSDCLKSVGQIICRLKPGVFRQAPAEQPHGAAGEG